MNGVATLPESSDLSAEIGTIGTELLLGDIVDTNAAYIAQQLARIGVQVFYRWGVGDNRERLIDSLQNALNRSDLVILTGGLGPTQDDLTTEAIAALFGVPLERHGETYRRIQERIQRLKVKVAESSYRMSQIPQGAVALPNGVGMAPGIWMEREGKLVIALPGVPSEMRHLMQEQVLPRLSERRGGAGVIRSRVLRLVGIAESLAEEKIIDLVRAQTNPTIAPYAGMGELKLRITARAPTEEEAHARIAGMESIVRERLGSHIYGADEETLDRAVGRHLLERRLRMAAAESCTGGLLSAALTEMPGSSAYFIAGEITYSNEAKHQQLGVPESVLQEYGAVSEPTARAMAEGVRRLHGVDIGVSITGIAGPDGGTEEKPVGLVYLGIADGAGTLVERRQFGGERSDVRRRSVIAALQLIYDRISAAR